MKKSTITFIKVVLLSLLVACSSSESPKSVAEKFLNSVEAKKYDEAKKYSTEETNSLLDMGANMSKMANSFGGSMEDSTNKKDNTKFIMGEEKIDGENATVTYKIVQKDKKDTAGNSLQNTVKLKKVKGKWLVAMSKTDMSGKGPQMPKASADSTAIDTTKKAM